ncbi:MAG: diguanylate cyclase [Ardenticatenaceae bacterium]
MKDSKSIQILYIEDDAGCARLFEKTMSRAGYHVDIARDGAEGLMMAASKAYDVVTVDQRMPVYDGLEVIRKLAARGCLGPTIMVTANGDEKVAVEAMKLGASDYLVKDADGGYLALLPTVIEQVLQKERLIKEKEAAMLALEQRNRNFALLNLVGQALTATLDLPQVIERLLQAATEILEVEDSSVWLWDDEEQGGLICKAVSHHSRNRVIVNARLRSGEGVAGWVAEEQKSTIVNNAQIDPRFAAHIDALAGAQTSTLIAVPLKARDQVIGVLEVVNKKDGNFDINDLTLLETLAASAAIAIHNAQLFAKVQRMATTDELTQLRNRRSFFAMSKHEFERAQRYGQPISAIMLDIDHFKKVNDTYGHAVGDEVLRVVAQRCRQQTRDFDILGRYGGEEFAVILPQTELPAATQVAGRLRESVCKDPIKIKNGEVTVTISLGVARINDAIPTLDALLDQADAALFAAKEAGRNQVKISGQVADSK